MYFWVQCLFSFYCYSSLLGQELVGSITCPQKEWNFLAPLLLLVWICMLDFKQKDILRFRSLSQISGGWHLFVSWVPLRPVLFNTVATSHMQLQSNWNKINLKCGSPFVLDTFQVFSGLWMQTREVSVFAESEIHLLIHYCYLTVGRWIYLCKTKIFQFFPLARNRKWKTTVPHGFPPIVGPTSSRLLQSSKV